MLALALALALDPGAPVAPHELPTAMIDPTDVVALVLMALLSMRRIELKGTDARAFPRVDRAAFDRWFSAAVSAKNLSVNACFLKFVLNSAWFYGFRGRLPAALLSKGGVAIFFGWLALLAYSFFLSSRAKRQGDALGIVVGRRIVEEMRPEPPRPLSAEDRDQPEASSRSEADA
ncbi:MAG TPA: hypothetical protein VF395_06160 [Polyangiaceae bacterium]